ncbi:uncharacterized protein isoform X2 [Rhodnius prolixus]
MDNTSPLYLAHQNGRIADNHLKLRKYDEAVECHQKASELLAQAMTLTKYTKALESLQLQHDYHVKQTDIIKARKLQFEIRQQLIELRKKKKMEKRNSSAAVQKDQDLQWAILRTMEEADSLLGMLGRRGVVGEDSRDGWQVENSPSSSDYVKHPKSEATVMEELRTVNTQLRGLVTELLSQLEVSRREIETLRARLRLYEDDSVRDLEPLDLPTFDYSTL